MQSKKQYGSVLQNSLSWRLSLLTLHLFFLVACGGKNQKEVEAQKSVEFVKKDSTQKQSIAISDTIVPNSSKIDSTDKPKATKNKQIKNNYPSKEICHPYIQTIILPNKQIKGLSYSEIIGSGENLVAYIFYDNDLMMCGDVMDGWYHQGVYIEFLNFQNLKTGITYKLPNENFKIASSASSAWGNEYLTEIGGKIIFQKLTRNSIAASVFLVDLKTHSNLFNKRNLVFSLKPQKFDEPKLKPYLSPTEKTTYISGLPPIPQPDPVNNLLSPPLDSATKAILRQEMEERNAPDPKDTTVYKVELDKKASYGRTGRLAYYLEKMDIEGLTTEVMVNLSYVIEKDGALNRLKIETKSGALTKEQLDYIRREIMIRYSKSWEPAKRYFRPVRSLVKEQIKLSSDEEF